MPKLKREMRCQSFGRTGKRGVFTGFIRRMTTAGSKESVARTARNAANARNTVPKSYRSGNTCEISRNS